MHYSYVDNMTTAEMRGYILEGDLGYDRLLKQFTAYKRQVADLGISFDEWSGKAELKANEQYKALQTKWNVERQAREKAEIELAFLSGLVEKILLQRKV